MANRNDQIQEIKMCIQTYFNIYGTIPTRQVLIEWLGTSYGDVLYHLDLSKVA